MDADPDAVRERATVTRLEPPLFDIDEEMWSAEDPATNCVGYGRVEAEAVGNLVAVVAEHADESEVGHVKLPGEVVERTWREEPDGVVSKLSNLF